MSSIKATLEARRRELKEKLKALEPLQRELEEVETLLETYTRSKRHGLETPGHADGCRCRECDPSW